MKIVQASDSSLLVLFGNEISPDLHRRVIALFRAVRAEHDARIRNVHPGYASVLIAFDPTRTTHDEMESLVVKLESATSSENIQSENVITIPVCYDAEFAPDLEAVAIHASLSTEEVIHLHSSATYVVYFLGFSPGFGYLGGLSPRLHIPRLSTPRKFVAAGTVAIAGSQAGIYPVDSPGGWQLIGRTPSKMFSPQDTPPTLLQPGDKVKFEAIDRATFDRMRPSA